MVKIKGETVKVTEHYKITFTTVERDLFSEQKAIKKINKRLDESYNQSNERQDYWSSANKPKI